MIRSFVRIIIAVAITSPAPCAWASDNPPTITSAGFASHHITIAWRTASNEIFDKFNVRYSPVPLGALPTWQNEVNGGSGGTFTWLPLAPAAGSYVFIVQGCKHGVFQSDCTGWSRQVTVTVPPEPVAATHRFSWPQMSSGDCRMQNAVVTFGAYGAGTFSAQVKTLHTHSGDVWHATITGMDTSGNTLVGLPRFDSMRMDDNHDWYNWSENFTYDQGKFSSIKGVNMKHSC
jgi:hypothetical protein